MTKRSRSTVNSGPKSATEEAIDLRTQQALDRIKGALASTKGDVAVRFFNEASKHGLIPNDENLVTWLDRTLGHDYTERFISAYVNLSCFYCTRGVVPCEDCEGRGHGADRRLCPTCLALGLNRCDFCGGSGWFTINHIPRAFQLPVIARRIAAATKEAGTVLASVVPNVADFEPAQARKLAAKALIQSNRLLSVFENMMIATKQEESRKVDATVSGDSLPVSCKELVPRLSERICTLLYVIAEAEAAESISASRKTTPHTAQGKIEFYTDLASSQNFEGTLLWHPLLIAELQSSSSASIRRSETCPDPNE